jgi:hypothetical protein
MKYLTGLKSLRLLLRIKQRKELRCRGRIIVESSAGMNLKNSVRNAVYQGINTTPYTPQYNGVAERMNMTLVEKARCKLSGVGLGKYFWVEAVGIACYLVNRSPSSTLDDKNPHEVWTGKKPSLTHLKVFGCEAYVHVPKENKIKLDKKAENCIFIGYKYGLKGYNIWNLETKKVVYSQDVVFREMKYVVK